MRFEAQIVSGQDIIVEIDFDDFMEQAFSGRDGDNDDLRKLNNIGGLFNRIPDSAIEKLTEGQRETIVKFLKKQAARFAPAGSV